MRGYTGDSMVSLTNGTVDFVAGLITDNLPVGVHGRQLLRDNVVCLMRRNHPLANKNVLTLEELLAYDHLKPWFKGINDKGPLDTQLKKMDVGRFIRVETPYLLTIIRTLLCTDTICLGMASWLPAFGTDDLASVAVPDLFDQSFAEVHLLWDERNHNDPASQWFRQLLVDIAVEQGG
ncbi:MAG: LysR substrate-binding domain-containing protein [Motiliproteus sp.]